MGLVYVYLSSWVAGGVLLGATMLLQHQGEADEGDTSPPKHVVAPPLSLATLALIGFGLGGLATEGLGLVAPPYTALCAALGAALIAALGYFIGHRQPHRGVPQER